MTALSEKRRRYLRRKGRVRKRIFGTPERPRLCVSRSHRHIRAQLIDDGTGRTLAAASSLSPELKLRHGGNVEAARKVGELLAKRAKEAGLTAAAFDRGGRKYHGRIRALAEAARSAGLKF